MSGRRTTLVDALEQSDIGLREVDDKELLDQPGDIVDVVVTSAASTVEHCRISPRSKQRAASSYDASPALASRW